MVRNFIKNDDVNEISIENFPPIDQVIRFKYKDENRKDLLHKVTHFLAAGIILTFLGLLIIQIIFRPENLIIPDYFISIVSVVVGFYFARSLPFNNK